MASWASFFFHHMLLHFQQNLLLIIEICFDHFCWWSINKNSPKNCDNPLNWDSAVPSMAALAVTQSNFSCFLKFWPSLFSSFAHYHLPQRLEYHPDMQICFHGISRDPWKKMSWNSSDTYLLFFHPKLLYTSSCSHIFM